MVKLTEIKTMDYIRISYPPGRFYAWWLDTHGSRIVLDGDIGQRPDGRFYAAWQWHGKLKYVLSHSYKDLRNQVPNAIRALVER